MFLMKNYFKITKRICLFVLSVAIVLSTLSSEISVSDASEREESNVFEKEFSRYVTGGEEMENFVETDVDAISPEEFDEIVEQDTGDNIKNDVYPSSVDLSKSKYFPPVDSQKSIGACVSWADIYYAFTFANCKAKNVEAKGKNIMSPAFIYNQTKDEVGTHCPNECKILLTEGVPSRQSADFESYYHEELCKSWFPSEDIWREAGQNRMTSYTCFDDKYTITSPKDEDLNNIKGYLNSEMLVTYTTDFAGWVYKEIPSDSVHAGESIVPYDIGGDGYHRMTIVGYDDNIFFDINGDGKIQEPEKGAFKVVNSWGENYQDKGFCWVSYDAVNENSQVPGLEITNRKGIFGDYYVFFVKEGGEKPSGTEMVMTLNTASRNEMKISIQAINAAGEEKSEYVSASSVNNNFNCAMDGADYATDGTILYDLNNIVPDITKDTVADYEWYVTVSDNSRNNSSVILKDARIKIDGNVYAALDSFANEVNGNSERYKLVPVTDNTTTVYYKNDAWQNANIHFCVNGKSWTKAPGIKMEKSDLDGYSWKYKINMFDESGVSVCFNNGSMWDSRNGKNYNLGVGRYAVLNGKIVNLDEVNLKAVLSSDEKTGGINTASVFRTSVETGTPVTYTYYAYSFGTDKYSGYVKENTTENSFVFTPDSVGEYTIEVEVKDSLGNVATDKIEKYVVEGSKIDNFNVSIPSPQYKGKSVTLSADLKNIKITGWSYKYFTISDGTRSTVLAASLNGNHMSAVWTPEKPGTYTITANYRTFGEEDIVSSEIEYTILNEKVSVIYYNNDSWSEAFIHYKVDNGSWTGVPGVKMSDSDRDGYKWMYVIPVGDSNGVTVCFNDGNNNWDSRNCANYYIPAGIYGVKNGSIGKID